MGRAAMIRADSRKGNSRCRAARPDDTDARYDAAVALTLLGLTEAQGGDLITPEPRYREALAEHRALAARDEARRRRRILDR